MVEKLEKDKVEYLVWQKEYYMRVLFLKLVEEIFKKDSVISFVICCWGLS